METQKKKKKRIYARFVIEIIIISSNGGHLMIRLYDAYTVIVVGYISSQKL